MGENYNNLQVLSKINTKTVSQFSLNDTYQTLIDIGCEELAVDDGAFILNDQGQIDVKEIVGLNTDYLKLNYSLYNSILNKVKEDEIMTINNLQEEKIINKQYQDLFIKDGFKSLLAAPIFIDHELEGFLIFLHRTETYFSEQSFLPVETIITQAPLVIKKAKIFQKMERNVAGLSILQKTSSTINSTLKLEKVFNLTVDVIMGTMGVSMAGLFLLDENKKSLDLVASAGAPNDNKKKLIEKTKELSWIVINENKTAIEDEIPIEHDELDEFNMKSGMIIPLTIRGEVIGTVAAGQVGFKRNFTEADTRFVTTLANQIAIAIENARMYNQMEELATKDGLTKLYNHSHFQEILAKEIKKAERYNRGLSLLMMDIDNFKEFNDFYGHQVGDEVLKKLAKFLKKEVRNADVVARYGGEEFAVILPETDAEGALQMGQRLNNAIKEMVIEYEDLELEITVSIGASTYHQGKSQKDLINDSDEALYRAKDRGKDQTCSKEFCTLGQ